MSRLSQAQSKLNDALAALESALASAHVNSGSKTMGDPSLDSARLLADLKAVDAKVARAVDMINTSLTAGNGDGDKR
jgi:hypothetical protein